MSGVAPDVEIQNAHQGGVLHAEQANAGTRNSLVRGEFGAEPVLPEQLREHTRCGLIERSAPGDA
jgi:hypothetical protein